MMDSFAGVASNETQIDTEWRMGYNMPTVENGSVKTESSHLNQNLGTLVEYNGLSDEQISGLLSSAKKLDVLLS